MLVDSRARKLRGILAFGKTRRFLKRERRFQTVASARRLQKAYDAGGVGNDRDENGDAWSVNSGNA